MRARTEGGFTYLELLLALGNLALGMAALGSLNSVVGQRNTLSQEIAAATLIAQTQMEQLKMQGYDALVDTGGAVDGTLGPLNAQGAGASSGRYTVTWDIRNNVPTTGARRVLVTVSWVGVTRRQRQVTLDTVLIHELP